MPRAAALALLLTFALAAGCGREEEEKAGPAPTAPRKLEAYRYPAPVSGHLSEVNTGDFDLVDGIAHPARDPAKGTVVFVTAKSIASPVLATSSCPATQARALMVLRNAGYAEVTLDAKGRSETFIFGSPYGGQSRGIDVGHPDWRGKIATEAGRAKGSVTHADYGGFEFELPIARTQPGEASEEDRMAAGYAAWGGDAPVPSEADAIAAYGLARRAVLGGDLAGYLEALGFDEEQADKIRGLPGIDADFAAHRDRFLEPGDPEPSSFENGFAAIGARGTNSKGEAFANYYEFTPCGGKLILTSIGLNPQ